MHSQSARFIPQAWEKMTPLHSVSGLANPDCTDHSRLAGEPDGGRNQLEAARAPRGCGHALLRRRLEPRAQAGDKQDVASQQDSELRIEAKTVGPVQRIRGSSIVSSGSLAWCLLSWTRVNSPHSTLPGCTAQDRAPTSEPEETMAGRGHLDHRLSLLEVPFFSTATGGGEQTRFCALDAAPSIAPPAHAAR